jgi:hypothetical protein
MLQLKERITEMHRDRRFRLVRRDHDEDERGR